MAKNLVRPCIFRFTNVIGHVLDASMINTNQRETDMTNFFTWFDKVRNEALATEDGKRFVEAGFDVYHTGGGCLAWHKQLPNNRYILITDMDSGLLVDPTIEGDCYFVGLYDEDADCEEKVSEMPNAIQAIDYANTLK